MKPKIVFIVSCVTDSHYKNRILEFVDNGYEVEVFGYHRANHKEVKDSPYEIHILGNIKNGSYWRRIQQYRKDFVEIGRKFAGENVTYFLGGLDVAMFFLACNRKTKYIYEECDLTHTYTKLGCVLKYVDRYIIKRSCLTIVTSEGFIKYHFGNSCPENICLVANKLNLDVCNCEAYTLKAFDKKKLSIGFVGYPRYNSICNFIDVFCREYPQYDFHVFGGPVSEQFEELKKHPNCKFYGFFKNPTDLPRIYSQIDLVLATYDVDNDNVRYAEPNKLYESIYFETPIIVSTGTFIGEKITTMNIGYEVDALDEASIKKFVDNLSIEDYNNKLNTLQAIDKRTTLNVNTHLFEKLHLLGI